MFPVVFKATQLPQGIGDMGTGSGAETCARAYPRPRPAPAPRQPGPAWLRALIKTKTQRKLLCRSSSRVASRPQKDHLWRTEKLGLTSNKIGFTAEICSPREPR